LDKPGPPPEGHNYEQDELQGKLYEFARLPDVIIDGPSSSSSSSSKSSGSEETRKETRINFRAERDWNLKVKNRGGYVAKRRRVDEDSD
jgi:hypothetical protein